MADRDETQPVLEEGEVLPPNWQNNPNTPTILQWRDIWQRESRPDFVGPPNFKNPLWDISDYERNWRIEDAEKKRDWDNESRYRHGRSQA